MYNCDCCGRYFDEPVLYRENCGECFGFPSYEQILGCPFCGGDYEEIEDDDYTY